MCTKFDPVASFFSTHRRGWYSELSLITLHNLLGYMSLDTLVSSLMESVNIATEYSIGGSIFTIVTTNLLSSPA